MRINHLLFIFIIVGLFACKKDEPDPIDFSDSIVEMFSGISVKTVLTATPPKDTSAAIVEVIKNLWDSTVTVKISSIQNNDPFTFQYSNGEYISTLLTHPPRLSMTNDSLYFMWQPGLGPNWAECFAEKDN